MDERRRKFRKRTAHGSGFSLTELVVALAIALILMAIGMPSFLTAYRSYQLSNAAIRMAEILRLTRYEAIRLNKPVGCVVQPSTTDPTMTAAWVDSNMNSIADPTEKIILLGPAGNLVDSGSVPGAGALPAQANLSGATPTTPSVSGATVLFDARGAVTPPNVNVFYLASGIPDPGFRAVILMPAGSIQIWTGDASGNWQQLR